MPKSGSICIRTLVSQRRDGRSLIYAADYAAMDGLMGFLTENCCEGAPCDPAQRNDQEHCR